MNLADAVTDYADEATSAMDGAIVAPSDRELVTDYFDQLQNRDMSPQQKDSRPMDLTPEQYAETAAADRVRGRQGHRRPARARSAPW